MRSFETVNKEPAEEEPDPDELEDVQSPPHPQKRPPRFCGRHLVDRIRGLKLTVERGENEERDRHRKEHGVRPPRAQRPQKTQPVVAQWLAQDEGDRNHRHHNEADGGDGDEHHQTIEPDVALAEQSIGDPCRHDVESHAPQDSQQPRRVAPGTKERHEGEPEGRSDQDNGHLAQCLSRWRDLVVRSGLGLDRGDHTGDLLTLRLERRCEATSCGCSRPWFTLGRRIGFVRHRYRAPITGEAPCPPNRQRPS